jgi:23S rRNA (adenine2030-N6)-methyltransferase
MHLLRAVQRCDGRALSQLRRRASDASSPDQEVNYRHAYHAGNFADVVKHLALVAVLDHLKRKDKPFAVIDTHAGRGLYDLQSEEASKTGEAEAGIRRLAGLDSETPLIAEYLKRARAFGAERYPGSPLITAQMLREQDRLVAVEKHEEDARTLTRTLAPFGRARAMTADGYERLIALLPPPERRGVVLIDPPYEAADEFEQAARAFAQAYRRFATGIYLLWFPIKSASAADAFCAEVLSAGVTKALRVDIDMGAAAGDRLRAAGLLIVNPPFGIDGELRAALQIVTPKLADAAKFSVSALLGDDTPRHE